MEDSGIEGHTHVHSCPGCFEKTLSTYWKDKTHKVVHPDCPRWHPLQGSALNCDGCANDAEELRKLHPNYQRLIESASQMFSGILASVKALRDDEETPQPEKKAGLDAWSLANMPFTFTDQEDLDEGAFVFAYWTLRPLLSHAPQGVKDEMAKRDAVWRTGSRYDWLEILYLSYTRNHAHEDAAGRIAREWHLQFRDSGVVGRGMMQSRLTLSEKKMLFRTWRKIIGDALDSARAGEFPTLANDMEWLTL